MTARIKMRGKRFGRLVVLGHLGRADRTRVRCRCDCGTISDHDAADLRRGHVQSCGCYATERRRVQLREVAHLRWEKLDCLTAAECEHLARWVLACGYKGLAERTGAHWQSLRRARRGLRLKPSTLKRVRALLAQPAPRPRCQYPGCEAVVVHGTRGRRCIYCLAHRVTGGGRPRPKDLPRALPPAPPQHPPCPVCAGPMAVDVDVLYCVRRRCEEALARVPRRAA